MSLPSQPVTDASWRNWGPYLSERSWGNLREDYKGSEPWSDFPFEQAHLRAYRWSEDGLGGLCNRDQDICLAVAFWNEQDAILKERLFGLANPQGNHGEDIKDYAYYLDATPNYKYLKMLYKYPQVCYPYEQLLSENQSRGEDDEEFELIDALRETFEANRYFDVFIEYAKAGTVDILCRISVLNRASEPAPIHVLPHLWYRNVWSWGDDVERPNLRATGSTSVMAEHSKLGQRWWYVQADGAVPSLLFTENDTNREQVFSLPNESRYVKDGINAAVVNRQKDCVNPDGTGTKCAAHFQTVIAPGETFQVNIRFSDQPLDTPFSDFAPLFEQAIAEADGFYEHIQPSHLSDEERRVQRQAFAGLLWCKQYYHFDVGRWLDGDPNQPAPQKAERKAKNAVWRHLQAHDVLSMPDKWEYPWFGAWDLAFQEVTIALIDPEDAKRQVLTLLDSHYQHPQGALPAFEADFSKQNPPIHAWAVWHIFDTQRRETGDADYTFLECAFHRLMLNFSWWLHCVDPNSDYLFGGGFLGMDNISLIDRSELPVEGTLDQADGTGWAAFYALKMFRIALELAQSHPAYEDLAIYFLDIAQRIVTALSGPDGLWDEKDGFFYDVLRRPKAKSVTIPVRSYVGLIPFLAVQVFEARQFDRTPRLLERLQRNARSQEAKPALVGIRSDQFLLSVLEQSQLERLLACVFDPDEFLSDYGIRSVSKYHQAHIVSLGLDGMSYQIGYEPGDAQSKIMGGNSNWRGPIWAPINHLMIEALRKYHQFYGTTLAVPAKNESGQPTTLGEAADDLCRRLVGIFASPSGNGKGRPVYGNEPYFDQNSDWNRYIWFFEHFHGDGGYGLGASHQNGWTALIAKLIQDGGRP